MKSNISKKQDDVFAVRCYRNGKRMLTSTLTPPQAANFLVAVKHLEKYLKSAYKLK